MLGLDCVLVVCEECYITLSKIDWSINMHTKNTRNELTRLVIGTIFLVHELHIFCYSQNISFV